MSGTWLAVCLGTCMFGSVLRIGSGDNGEEVHTCVYACMHAATVRLCKDSAQRRLAAPVGVALSREQPLYAFAIGHLGSICTRS